MTEEEQGYKLVNAYEPAVTLAVRKLMAQDSQMCCCEKCFLDVCALVYNSGFIHFVTTQKGELLASLYDMDDTRRVELLVAAVKAIETVKEQPGHNMPQMKE